MTLLDEIRDIKSTRKDLRGFGLSVGLVLCALGGLLLWRGRPASSYFLGAGAFLVVSALAFPVLLKPVQKAWMALAAAMGWVMTRVLLGLLFYLVITPVSLASRLSGKRFMDIDWGRKRRSYWNHREPKQGGYDKQY